MDEDECFAVFIDGSWTYCGCIDCNDRESEDAELSGPDVIDFF